MTLFGSWLNKLDSVFDVTLIVLESNTWLFEADTTLRVAIPCFNASILPYWSISMIPEGSTCQVRSRWLTTLNESVPLSSDPLKKSTYTTRLFPSMMVTLSYMASLILIGLILSSLFWSEPWNIKTSRKIMHMNTINPKTLKIIL